MPRFSLTTPIFYVNGPPHIGHAYTVVAADVLARAHRQRGDDVFFLAGTDEHGAKIAEAAGAAGKDPQTFADEMAGTFRTAWQGLDVKYDDFLRTTERRHLEGVRRALGVLRERGYLSEKCYRGLYCVGCENFLTEKDLDHSGKCPLHNRTPEVVAEKNWFFRLSPFLGEVRRRVESGELSIEPAERKNEVLGLLSVSGADFSVSRPRERVPWALPLPFDETQTCYVWVDALLNYVTALGYGSPETSRLGRCWPADLQIIGRDILKFHAVYWPALLLALELPLPRTLFVHGFFTVNGQKISKSLGNTIDPRALVARYGSDATRFLLLSQFPFGTSGDFAVRRFDERYNAILANTIGNLVSRTITLVQKFCDGKVPDAEPDRSVLWERVPPRPTRVIRGDGEALREDFAWTLDSLVDTPVRLARRINQYANRTAPWKESDPQKRAAALRTLVNGVAHLAQLSAPLLLHTSAAVQDAVGSNNGAPPSTGAPVHPPDPPLLFPRLT